MSLDKQSSAFMSYSRANKDFALKLTQELRNAGYRVWFDQLDIPAGARWDDEVEKALRESSIFMVILTPASIASENVKDEIGYAIDHGKKILPFLLEDCDVPLRLRRFQYVDFTVKNFKEGLQSAKELLTEIVNEDSQPVKTMMDPDLQAQAEQAELEPKIISAPSAQKKPISKTLIIGVAVALFISAVIGFGLIVSSNTPAVSPAVDTPLTNSLPDSQINGLTVNKASYDGGEFIQTGSDSWTEHSPDSEFYFIEQSRDERSVYLYDDSRNMNVQLDLYKKQIFFDANDGDGLQFLTAITGVEGQ